MEEQEKNTEAEKAIVPVEKDENITELPFTQNMVVVARTPQELVKAQAHLVGWVAQKIVESEKNSEEIEANIKVAKKNRWRVTTLQSQGLKARKEIIFYKKVRAALEAGYYLVPNFPIDVFAIRTERTRPKRHESSYANNVAPQVTESPQIGKGKFRDSVAVVMEETWTEKNKEGKDVTHSQFFADQFRDVAFPFTLARPEVMTALAKSLSEKIFDEIGCLPGRPGNRSSVSRRGDPMIIGRVMMRNGYQEKSISFLISWFVDTRDL